MDWPAEEFRFHHLGIAVPSIDTALPIYRNLFGYELDSGPFSDPIQRVTVCFLKRPADPVVLELIAPDKDDSPIRLVLRRGGGAYHTCYEVRDLARAMEHCVAIGCLVVNEPAPALAFNNRRIAWLNTPSRQLLELVEAASDDR
jgi:methylmalonyl-CoA/ethylmalonyl-CoA epimerase